MKANIINGAKSANKEESDQIVHRSMERVNTSVTRVGNIHIVTPLKALGKAEKSEKFAIKLAWAKEQQWNMPSKIEATL